MSFWLRELVGWLLLLLGLAVFGLCVLLVLSLKLFEAGPVLVVGIFVFRGGLHLLKVAVAARICAQVPKQAAPVGPRVAPKPLAPTTQGWGPGGRV